jgi:hypothetical protein
MDYTIRNKDLNVQVAYPIPYDLKVIAVTIQDLLENGDDTWFNNLISVQRLSGTRQNRMTHFQNCLQEICWKEIDFNFVRI